MNGDGNRGVKRASPERVLSMLRALYVIVEDPTTEDLRMAIDGFANRAFVATAYDRQAELRQLGNEMLGWTQRHRDRLAMCIEESLGGDEHVRTRPDGQESCA